MYLIKGRMVIPETRIFWDRVEKRLAVFPPVFAYWHRKSKGLKLTNKVKILSFAFGIKANSEDGKMQRFDLLPYMIMMLFEFLNVGHEFAFFQNI